MDLGPWTRLGAAATVSAIALSLLVGCYSPSSASPYDARSADVTTGAVPTYCDTLLLRLPGVVAARAAGGTASADTLGRTYADRLCLGCSPEACAYAHALREVSAVAELGGQEESVVREGWAALREHPFLRDSSTWAGHRRWVNARAR